MLPEKLDRDVPLFSAHFSISQLSKAMMHRRRFLEVMGGGALFATRARAVESRGKPPFRVLYSNDTTNVLGCTSPWHAKGAPFGPELIEASVDEVAGLVDAHFLQP